MTAGTLDNPDTITPIESWFAEDKVQWTRRDGALKAWPWPPES
ncbi:MAG: hypothetical protein WC807_12280 [Hyphomicrobium sp.]